MGGIAGARGKAVKGAAQFWLDLLPPESDGSKPASKRREYCLKVLDLLKKSHPDLLHGRQAASLSEKQAQQLTEELQKNTPGHVLKHRISYLIRGLEYGSLYLGWDVVIPEPPVVIPREKPRINRESFLDLPFVYALEEAYLQNLKQPPPESCTLRIGQLLMSAVLFGGLVHKKWLTAWVEALPTAVVENDVLWLDMTVRYEHEERERRADQAVKPEPKKKEDEDEDKQPKADHTGIKDTWEIKKRWFADPLTHALINRWHSDFPSDSAQIRVVSPVVALRNFSKLLPISDKKVTDDNLKVLLRGCATRLGIQVPPFLQAYAEGRIKSVSLPDHVWLRLLKGTCIRLPDHDMADGEEFAPIDAPMVLPDNASPAVMVRQEEMLRKVLSEILPSDVNWKQQASQVKEALLQHYEQQSGQLCEVLSCLLLWCADLLTAYNRKEMLRGRSASKLRVSSVRGYLSAIGRRLLAVVGTARITELDGDELHDLYAEAIESCPTAKSKNFVGARLYAFHQFLTIRLGAEFVDFSDLTTGSGPAELSVNANLVSPYSFDLLKKILCPNFPKASRLRKIQLLAAILAFRCGLRRMEVLKLRLIDLQGVSEPELLVRNNQYGYVKSNESIRRLPVWCLLEADELQSLMEWRTRRGLEAGSEAVNALLFCMEGQPTQRLGAHLVMKPIQQAMHQATGDASLVFHHLRHSFATWLLLRLLPAIPEETRRKVHFLQHKCFDPDPCATLRSALLTNRQLGRQTLYATAQLCGHITPEVTLLHYFHLCDFLLQSGLAMPSHQPVLDAATIMAVTRLPQHNVYYARKTAKAEHWQMSFVIERLAPPERMKSSYAEYKAATDPIPELGDAHSDDDLPLWVRVFAVIKERQIGKLTFEALAARSGLTEPDIVFWVTNLERLSEMRTGKGKLRHINSVTTKRKSFYFPQQARLKQDRAMASSILGLFEVSRGSVRGRIVEGARYFAHHFVANKASVRFQAMQELKRYLSFLRLIKLESEHLRITRLQARRTRLAPSVEQQRLAQKLKLTKSSIVVLEPETSVTYRNGYYLVQVTDNYGTSPAQASYGFRFALYLIVIMAGLDDVHLS